MRVALMMILSLAMILFGAELFTNAVEWLGKKLSLGEGTVGSVFAALGTALPETAVPVTAILTGGGTHAAEEVGIGGILGAPFLLATLGSLVMALSIWMVRRGQEPPLKLDVGERGFQREMVFFLVAYAIALAAGCINDRWVHVVTPLILTGMYLLFLSVTLRDKRQTVSDDTLAPLYLQTHSEEPTFRAVLIQVLVALALIVGGARLLTIAVETVAVRLAVPTFVLSALLIPLVTELPETFNSVVWIRQGKDGLAAGNITGAMVFQSTLVPALGIWLTPWALNWEALLTGTLTLAAAALLFGVFRLKGYVSVAVLIAASLLYWILPLQTIATPNEADLVYWSGIIVIVIGFVWAIRHELRTTVA